MAKPFHKKLNPIWWFLNDDDPHPPEKYKPTSPKWWRYAYWYWRNPLHNFFWYVVGIHDRDNSEVVVWRIPDHLHNPNGGWNWSVIKCGRLFYPFISYKGKRLEKFYLGWRPERGAFGFKLNFHFP